MCESKLYELSGGEKKLLMEDVIRIEIEGSKITATDILGNRKEMRGRVKEIDLGNHEILLLPEG
ncbi:MAG: CooT family nickel-binding protein [Archaeoglobi archaeon]|nr:CooT family nickel-binding protein [Candidatus Mnemosynella bozhongmuii]